MSKISGIKSVDFKIKANGHGVVNWNGSTTLVGDGGKTVDNHMLPKLRGYSSLSGKIKEETGYKYKKDVQDIDLSKTPLYVSQNCIRHHLFKEQTYELHFANKSNINKLLASASGLLRGYVMPSSQNKRTSPLLLEDLVDQLKNGNFEQFATDMPNEKVEGKNGEEDTYKRASTTIYSKTTFGETGYIGYGSINIEDLQFISLDQKFDRCAMIIKSNQGIEVAQEIEDFIKSLDKTNSLNPKAVYHENYVRLGSIYNEGEAGVLLNDDAIHLLVQEMLERIENLYIKQAKGYLFVDELVVDYNDSNSPMRIKKDEMSINSTKGTDYAVYYKGE